MYEHSSFCQSGDNTLAAAIAGVETIAAEPADDRMLFLMSDALLSQYGVSRGHTFFRFMEPARLLISLFMYVQVTPKSLADALISKSSVNSYALCKLLLAQASLL